MTDPLGLIARTNGGMLGAPPGGRAPRGPADGPGSFGEALRAEIDRVNALQRDAAQAAEDLATGDREDVEGAILATQKADAAFRLLLQVRNKVMEAYDEIKQVRV